MKTSPGMPKAVIFDFDLTLGDSSRAVVDCVGYALSDLGFESVEPETIRHTIGLSLEASLEYLTGQSGSHLQEQFRSRFMKRADEVMVQNTDILAGVAPALDNLRERGLRLGIVSNKLRSRIQAILRWHGIQDRFHAVVGSGDAPSPKPHPDGLRLALNSLDSAGHDALYVGDHLVDAEAASRVPMPFVGVLTGTTAKEEFRAFPHLGILESAADLPTFLSEGRMQGIE